MSKRSRNQLEPYRLQLVKEGVSATVLLERVKRKLHTLYIVNSHDIFNDPQCQKLVEFASILEDLIQEFPPDGTQLSNLRLQH